MTRRLGLHTIRDLADMFFEMGHALKIGVVNPVCEHLLLSRITQLQDRYVWQLIKAYTFYADNDA